MSDKNTAASQPNNERHDWEKPTVTCLAPEKSEGKTTVAPAETTPIYAPS